jgi:heat shock protein HslJ
MRTKLLLDPVTIALVLLATTIGSACTGGSASSTRESSIVPTEPTGSASPGTGSPEPTPSLAGTSWVLTTADGSDWPVGSAPNVTLVFHDQRLGGFGGCNEYGAKWRMVRGRIEIGRIASTLVLCQGMVGRVEHRLLEVLAASPAVGVAGVTELRLTAAGGELIFARSFA